MGQRASALHEQALNEAMHNVKVNAFTEAQLRSAMQSLMVTAVALGTVDPDASTPTDMVLTFASSARLFSTGVTPVVAHRLWLFWMAIGLERVAELGKRYRWDLDAMFEVPEALQDSRHDDTGDHSSDEASWEEPAAPLEPIETSSAALEAKEGLGGAAVLARLSSGYKNALDNDWGPYAPIIAFEASAVRVRGSLLSARAISHSLTASHPKRRYLTFQQFLTGLAYFLKPDYIVVNFVLFQHGELFVAC